MRKARSWPFALCLLAVHACGGDGDDSDAAPKQRGTEACQAWQRALCAFAGRCGQDESKCLAQYASFECKSDAIAKSCTQKLEREATCAVGPGACDYPDVTNPEPAIAACEKYVDSACESAVGCRYEASVASCRENTGLDCTHAIGRSAEFDACIADLADLACEDWAVPDRCMDVILVQ